MVIRLELGSMQLLSGEQKRTLEQYIGSEMFKRRKTFDEYYLTEKTAYFHMGFEGLKELSKTFVVKILPDCVIVTNWE